MTWATSNRRSELPRDWPARRAAVKRRAHGQCEHQRDGVRCTNLGTECHHAGANTDHSIDALMWICKPCHTAETQRQSQGSRGIGQRKRVTARPIGLA